MIYMNLKKKHIIVKKFLILIHLKLIYNLIQQYQTLIKLTVMDIQQLLNVNTLTMKTKLLLLSLMTSVLWCKRKMSGVLR
jgi:hypothetical protein